MIMSARVARGPEDHECSKEDQSKRHFAQVWINAIAIAPPSPRNSHVACFLRISFATHRVIGVERGDR
jgi:hypothetical protein